MISLVIDNLVEEPDVGMAPPSLDALGFHVGKDGRSKSQYNIRRAMELMNVRVRYDSFQDRLIIEGLEGFGPLLDDPAMDRLWLLIDEQYHFRPSKDFFWTVVGDTARRNVFHPVLDYLKPLRWDNVKRIDTWLIDYAQAEDSEYVRAVGALMLIAAVRRVRQPGGASSMKCPCSKAHKV
jgi:predicted P-loop ATPase